MAFYTIKTDPKAIAAEEKEWFLAAVRRSEMDLDAARVRLEDAEEKYFLIDTPTYKDERDLAAAQEVFDRAEAVHAGNETKLDWEIKVTWKKKIETSVEYTKRLLASIDWQRIFKGRIK